MRERTFYVIQAGGAPHHPHVVVHAGDDEAKARAIYDDARSRVTAPVTITFAVGEPVPDIEPVRLRDA